MPAHELLAPWDNFYIIVGSVAGALTGLQFVVMALVADARMRTSHREIAAFGTPTVLHFCAALLISALLSIPWVSLPGLRIAFMACGLAGVLYAAVIMKRAHRTRNYRPVLEDWVWHIILPLLAYLGLLVAGVLLSRNPGTALALIAAVTLGLVFIGIHNAWDTITYIAVAPESGSESEPRSRRNKRGG